MNSKKKIRIIMFLQKGNRILYKISGLIARLGFSIQEFNFTAETNSRFCKISISVQNENRIDFLIKRLRNLYEMKKIQIL
ncbi:MAG TPA: ACT domain-containing protein [bacterium]|nr:ACT domain-containing protein [bacterium]